MTNSTVTLASGHKMPLVGFGLWKVPADKAADIVYNVSKTLALFLGLLTRMEALEKAG